MYGNPSGALPARRQGSSFPEAVTSPTPEQSRPPEEMMALFRDNEFLLTEVAHSDASVGLPAIPPLCATI